jgi:hypothetical protein
MLRGFIGLLIALLSVNSSAFGQEMSTRISLRVKVDDRIAGMYLVRGTPRDPFEQNLSEQLAAELEREGEWKGKFCWALTSEPQVNGAKLVFSLSAWTRPGETATSNWRLNSDVVITHPVSGRQSLSLHETTLLFRENEYETIGGPSPSELPKQLSRWFTQHVIRPSQEGTLHQRLCERVPIGYGIVSPPSLLAIAPDKPMSVICLMHERFRPFNNPEFRFECDKGIAVRKFSASSEGGAHEVEHRGERVRGLTVTHAALPPGVAAGDEALVYFVKSASGAATPPPEPSLSPQILVASH